LAGAAGVDSYLAAGRDEDGSVRVPDQNHLGREGTGTIAARIDRLTVPSGTDE